MSFQVSPTLIALIVAFVVTNAGNAQEPNTPKGLEVQSVVLHLLNEADVAAQVSGVVIDVSVREGDVVKKGQRLARIDDRMSRLAEQSALVELQTAQETAENDIDLRAAIQSFELAEAELKRSLDSNERFPKSVSQSQIDVERLTVEKARLEQEAAQHETKLAKLKVKQQEQALAAARVELALRRITAPISGMVVETSVRVGEWIELGAKAARIVSLDKLRAEGYVTCLPSELPQQGDTVLLKLVTNNSSPSNSFHGKVVFVSPEIDPITGQVRIWAEIENSQRLLRPGQRPHMWVNPSNGVE